MLSALSELEPRFRKSGQQQLLIETLLVRFALLDRTLSPRRACCAAWAADLGTPAASGRAGTRANRAAVQSALHRQRRDRCASRTAPRHRRRASLRSRARHRLPAASPSRHAWTGTAAGMTKAMDATVTGSNTALAADAEAAHAKSGCANAAPKDPVLGAAIDALDLELLD